MKYFEVMVSSQRYHSEKPLTYAFEKPLKAGTVVIVPMQRQKVAGIVINEVSKPSFPTKSIDSVVDSGTIPHQIVQLIEWLKAYYPAPSGQIVSLALPGSLATKSRLKNEENTSKKSVARMPALTTEQQQAVKLITDHVPKSTILHGDTGTGKTRVYLELTKNQLETGKSVIILTPEIGLTPQISETFGQAFPGQVVTVHSELGAARRRDLWLQILRSDQPLVVIGPRSALFSPLRGIGLIVVDEFHESSYKQEQAPHYQATRVAAKLAELHGAQLILGSATPPVSDYYTFKQKGLPIVRMTQPAITHDHREVRTSLVDLKDKNRFSRSNWISDDLLKELEGSLARNEQALVFLNRRGTARLTLCQTCGWQAFCPNCDLPLTYHGDSHTMRCHTCGHSQKAPSSCPVCSSNDIVFRNVGTKSIVSEIERLLPRAKTLRFDSDTHKNDSLAAQFSSVKAGEVDIIVGTQMLGKGLDLPKLGVVGIITAETSLSFPDYSAEERTFQLISQALGRVNRGHTPGTAIVQTYHPDSEILRAAIAKDYDAFYENQIAERQLYKFPPFRFTLKLTCTRAISATAKRNSVELAEKLRKKNIPVEVIGPNPAFTEKTYGKYRWQLIVKTTNRPVLTGIISDLPANWSFDIDPNNLL